METSLGMLLERLRWPLPRIRREAARALSILVRDEAHGVLDSLIEWIADCELESECLLGLGVVYAFELGDVCPEDRVRKALARPSLVSDWMMRRIYYTIDRSAPFRYTVSIPHAAHLNSDDAQLFDQYKTVAVPPTFLHALESLQQKHDFPFVDRWHHDWAWICRTHGVQKPQIGFFLGTGPGRGGTYQLQLSETLVSAYLRTLAYAIHVGRLRTDDAESYSMLALPMNRGLSRLQPVQQPGWSRNLLRRWRDAGKGLIKDLWDQSEQSTPTGEVPAALLLAEASSKNFIEINIDVVIASETQTAAEPVAEYPKFAWLDGETGMMGGRIHLVGPDLATTTRPLISSCIVTPENVGRIDTDIAFNVKLACIGLGSHYGKVLCNEREIKLEVGNDIVSRWYFWYTGWEPSMSQKQSTELSSITTIQWSRLRRAIEMSNVSFGLRARIRIGERNHIHEDYRVDDAYFWLKSEDLRSPKLNEQTSK